MSFSIVRGGFGFFVPTVVLSGFECAGGRYLNAVGKNDALCLALCLPGGVGFLFRALVGARGGGRAFESVPENTGEGRDSSRLRRRPVEGRVRVLRVLVFIAVGGVFVFPVVHQKVPDAVEKNCWKARRRRLG